MRLNPDDSTVRSAVFGRQVEDFLKGDIGDYLLQRAKEQEEEAMRALRTAAPWRRRRIQELQNRAALAASIMDWLGDAISDGHAALEIIKGEE